MSALSNPSSRLPYTIQMSGLRRTWSIMRVFNAHLRRENHLQLGDLVDQRLVTGLLRLALPLLLLLFLFQVLLGLLESRNHFFQHSDNLFFDSLSDRVNFRGGKSISRTCCRMSSRIISTVSVQPMLRAQGVIDACPVKIMPLIAPRQLMQISRLIALAPASPKGMAQHV